MIYRCYNIFQATRRTKYTSKRSKAGAIQIAVAAAAFLLFLILRTALAKDLVLPYLDVIEFGQSIRLTYKCQQDVWEYAILGVEVLMVIIGVGLAVQVASFRNSRKS